MGFNRGYNILNKSGKLKELSRTFHSDVQGVLCTDIIYKYIAFPFRLDNLKSFLNQLIILFSSKGIPLYKGLY